MPRPRRRRAIRSKGGGDRPEDHDHGHRDIDLLSTDHIRNAAKGERTDKGAENGGSRDPTGLERAEVPLDGHESGRRADDKQVIGVGEEADS